MNIRIDTNSGEMIYKRKKKSPNWIYGVAGGFGLGFLCLIIIGLSGEPRTRSTVTPKPFEYVDRAIYQRESRQKYVDQQVRQAKFWQDLGHPDYNN